MKPPDPGVHAPGTWLQCHSTPGPALATSSSAEDSPLSSASMRSASASDCSLRSFSLPAGPLPRLCLPALCLLAFCLPAFRLPAAFLEAALVLTLLAGWPRRLLETGQTGSSSAFLGFACVCPQQICPAAASRADVSKFAGNPDPGTRPAVCMLGDFSGKSWCHPGSCAGRLSLGHGYERDTLRR